MLNTFSLTINNSPATIYLMSRALISVTYKKKKFLLMIDYKGQEVYSSEKVDNLHDLAEKILEEMIERS